MCDILWYYLCIIMKPFTRHHSQFRTIEAASLEIIFLFIVPIALLYFGIIPIEYRIFVLLIFSLFIFGIIRKQKWKDEELGLTTKNISQAFAPYAIATTIALALIIFAAQQFNFHPVTQHWWTNPHFLFLFMVVSFFQEFAFRGFLMPLLKKVFPDSFTIITVNALLFSGMHAIYPFPYIGLPFAFIGGLFFAILYHKYPNLILISISHAILNFAVVWFGLFMIPKIF